MPCTTASSSGTSDTSDMSALPLLKRPAHIDEFLLYRLHTLTRIATQGVGLMFRRDIGVSRREWRVLAFVGRFPDLNLTRLADLAGLDTVIASRSVTQLVRRGLLVNTRAPANKRVSVLRLTEAGEAVHARAHAAARRRTPLQHGNRGLHDRRRSSPARDAHEQARGARKRTH